jgi:dynein heavy chain, axonemal
VGASCDNNGRKKFDAWIREKIDSCGLISMKIPEEGIVYDYLIDDGGIFEENDDDDDEQKIKPIQWRNWMTDYPELVLNNDTKFSDIIVPTIDNVRNAYLVELLLKNDKTVLCVGPTGTGKTLTIVDKLTRSMPKDFSPEFLNFSAKTSANQTQDLIDSKLDKRRKGIFGPPLGKYFVFFIDDLNMPAPEVYFAQPPIELIRQWMDFRGWYDRKAVGEFRNLVDINFCCAMGPPGGGRNHVTMRLTRHFNHLSFIDMENDSMRKIFSTILKWWTSKNDSNK